METKTSYLAVALIIGLLVGFGIGWVVKPVPVVEEAPFMLRVIGPWSGAEEEKFLPVLDKFTEETGILVDYRTMRAEDLMLVLPAQFSAEVAPADVIFHWASKIRLHGPEGHIVDVTDLVDEAKYSAGALDLVKVDGTLYGGVWTGKAKAGFWYSKSFFDGHGLTAPETWDEFKTLLATIKDIPGVEAPIASGDAVGWPLSDQTEAFLIRFGGPSLFRGLIDGTVSWTSPEVRSAMEKLTELLEAGYFSEPGEWTIRVTEFWQGTYALYFMGGWITGMVDDPDDMGVFPLPGTTGLVFAADYFFMPAYTEHPEEAEDLFEFLLSAEAQEIHVGGGGALATHVDVPLDAHIPVDRGMAALMAGKEVLLDLDDTIGGEFQVTFWDQLKLLWVQPEALDDVLDALQEKAP